MVKIGTEIESPQTGERLIFRSTADSSNGQLFQAELIVKPGPYVVGSHIHPRQEERFVVLEGAYGYRIGEATGVAQPGQTLTCPVGIAHSQWNAGDGILRIYYEHRPALTSAEIFFETQFGLSRDGKLSADGGISLVQGAVLLEEVGDFILPASPPLLVQKAVFPLLAALGRVRGYRARYEEYALPTE